jgi:hypothetical protein
LPSRRSTLMQRTCWQNLAYAPCGALFGSTRNMREAAHATCGPSSLSTTNSAKLMNDVAPRDESASWTPTLHERNLLVPRRLTGGLRRSLTIRRQQHLRGVSTTGQRSVGIRGPSPGAGSPECW